MTLTHSKNNNWADASTDKPTHNGLTEFGKEVGREMNRLGMVVDVSHVSDKTLYDTLAVTSKPVVVSHSSMSRFRMFRAMCQTKCRGRWPRTAASLASISERVLSSGVDHVGIGSEYDEIAGPPNGLEDVSKDAVADRGVVETRVCGTRREEDPG